MKTGLISLISLAKMFSADLKEISSEFTLSFRPTDTNFLKDKPKVKGIAQAQLSPAPSLSTATEGHSRAGCVTHDCNPGSREAEAGGWLSV